MRQWTVDAFAAEPFRGNPACVVEPFDAWPDDDWMAALARENNQAETAFLLRTDGDARYGLRWFTPGMEVPLCGHATLASAHILFAELDLDARDIAFQTRSAGVLGVQRHGEGYEMNFPADPPRRTPIPDGLASALGAQPVETWAGQYLLAVMESESVVRRLRPELAGILPIGGGSTGAPGQVIACAAADPGRPYAVVSRFFAPGCGVPEDPVTGSAHCMLAPLFAARFNRQTLRFHQAYPGRGGDLECEVRGERVLLRGSAVTVIEANLRLRP
jgi:PhzF family phenazine biosynthesis protein